MNKLTSGSGRSNSLFQTVLNVISKTFATAQSKMSPTLGPDMLPTPSLTGYGRPDLSLRRSSTSSLQSEGDNVTIGTSPAYSSSSLSIPFEDGDVDVVRMEGVRHSHIRLEARRYKFAPFTSQLLDILHTLRAPSWDNPGITPDRVEIQKVSGSMTNAVFFVSCPSIPNTRILLLRIYGPLSGSMISRPRELHILHVLSSQYRIGPRVFGTFENGRIEEYFDATTLTAADLRDRQISSWIGARMAELHSVDIKAVEPPSTNTIDDTDWIAVKKNVESWLVLAREVLALPGAHNIRTDVDLDRFQVEWERYLHWLEHKEESEGASQRIFAHNDTQYGNLLRMKNLKEGMPEHHQIIVVDFEYASPNPAAFDIANHFHEWTANYHSDTPHLLNSALYPNLEQRRNFYCAYLKRASLTASPPRELSDEDLEAMLEKLECQVQAWSPASHAMWALWGVIQAREIIEGSDGEPEYDYLGYSLCRLEGFRRELRALGL